MTAPGKKLRAAMDKGCIPIPGAFAGLPARSIAAAGFPACYVSGAATSVLAGVPDVGLLSLEHFCRMIREVADASGLPVLADADTGFGEAEMVRRTVIEYARAGAAGLHIEDQEFPKRCGHLDGKRLVPEDHMCEKVQWAAGAKPDGFVLCARTDARGVDGFDAAVNRARAYVRAGADMIFPEGLTSESEFARFAEAMGRGSAEQRSGGAGAPLRHPVTPYLLANMTEFGKTPSIPLQRFAEMGYSAVIYPVTLLRVAMGAVTRALAGLKRDGSADAFLPEMQSRQDLYGLIGYTPGTPWEFPAGER
ncbi:MAG: isocitrate lyase/phosphoenolpyruvate mutase family protein [Phycisphaerales bacterium]|nr:isocitrate lyase/phosphoenolpyruvate mutase family protein [Phycisphaerales bacterium]